MNGLTITQHSKPGEGDLDPRKLVPYASIKPGGSLYDFHQAGGRTAIQGMGSNGKQAFTGGTPAPAPAAPASTAGKGWANLSEAERMAHSQRWGTDYAKKNQQVGTAVQPGQATFIPGSTTNPAVKTTHTASAPATHDTLEGMDAYSDYIDRAFGFARRSLDPMMDRDRSRFDQTMINKGIAPGTEAYGLAMDEMTRGHNDLMSSAAFQAMGFGSELAQNDRQYGMQSDMFDLNELQTIDGINRAWNDQAYRDAVFNTGREDQQFNQMLSLFGMTPVGSTQPFNMGQAFSNQYNADLNAQLINNNMWSQVGGAAQEAIPAIWDAVKDWRASGASS